MGDRDWGFRGLDSWLEPNNFAPCDRHLNLNLTKNLAVDFVAMRLNGESDELSDGLNFKWLSSDMILLIWNAE